jgi:flagellar hook-associated protein 3 FlgL
MTIRITEGAASYGSLVGLQSAAARLASAQAKLSSGKQITTPSDDPSGTVRALQLRADLKRNTQYTANASDAIGWMSTADTTYTQIVKLAQNARTLVVQGLNTGVNSAASQNSIADQIDAIRNSLISLANTTYNGRPLFAGTADVTAAYDPTGAYQGDTGEVYRAVGPNATVRINQNGEDVFGPAGNDMFKLLDDISTDLRSGTLTGSRLTDLDGAIRQVSTAQATEGAAYQRVEVAQAAQANTSVTLKSQLSDIQDIDLADMAVQVATANTNYQAALQTTASIRQLSLLNFLN